MSTTTRITTQGTTSTATVYNFSAIDLLDTDVAAFNQQILVTWVDRITGISVTKVETTDFTLTLPAQTMTFDPAPGTGNNVVITRQTKADDRWTDFTGLSFLRAEEVDLDSDQLFYLIQENKTIVGDAMVKTLDASSWEGQGLPSSNCLAATSATGWVTLAQANALISGAEIASTSEGNYQADDGTGSQLVYPLSTFPTSDVESERIWVIVGGILQRPVDDYAYALVAGIPTVTFVVAPPTGTKNVVFRNLTGTVQTALGIASVDGEAIIDGTLSVNALDQAAGTINRFIVFNAAGVAAVSTIAHDVITDFDTGVRTNRIDQMADAQGEVGMGTNKITALGTGATGTTDGCNVTQMESYVAAQVGSGIDVAATTLTAFVVNTPKTNSTGKAIFVIAKHQNNVMAAELELDPTGAPGVFTIIAGSSASGAGQANIVSFFVPDGAQYKFTTSAPSTAYVQTF